MGGQKLVSFLLLTVNEYVSRSLDRMILSHDVHL